MSVARTALRWFDVEGGEFACRCGRPDCPAPRHPFRLLGLHLDRAREMLGQPIVVTSGNRCPTHNEAVGGQTPSEHVYEDGCLGVDIACSRSRDRAHLYHALQMAGITRIVLYATHLHAGIGNLVDEATFPGDVLALGRA